MKFVGAWVFVRRPEKAVCKARRVKSPSDYFAETK